MDQESNIIPLYTYGKNGLCGTCGCRIYWSECKERSTDWTDDHTYSNKVFFCSGECQIEFYNKIICRVCHRYIAHVYKEFDELNIVKNDDYIKYGKLIYCIRPTPFSCHKEAKKLYSYIKDSKCIICKKEHIEDNDKHYINNPNKSFEDNHNKNYIDGDFFICDNCHDDLDLLNMEIKIKEKEK